MFAIARINTFDPERLDRARAEVEEFGRLHAGQPGYAGSLTVDLGNNDSLTVNLWQSEQAAAEGRSRLGSEAGKVLGPLMTAPSRLLGTGHATTDLATTDVSPRVVGVVDALCGRAKRLRAGPDAGQRVGQKSDHRMHGGEADVKDSSGPESFSREPETGRAGLRPTHLPR